MGDGPGCRPTSNPCKSRMDLSVPVGDEKSWLHRSDPFAFVDKGRAMPDGWQKSLHIDGGARNPKVPTMFQVADVDDGTIRWVNADLVSHIVPAIRGVDAEP